MEYYTTFPRLERLALSASRSTREFVVEYSSQSSSLAILIQNEALGVLHPYMSTVFDVVKRIGGHDGRYVDIYNLLVVVVPEKESGPTFVTLTIVMDRFPTKLRDLRILWWHGWTFGTSLFHHHERP